MERKECFGSIREIVFDDHMTITQTSRECRDCQEFRECLQLAKEKEELKKQNLIAKMIDLSEIHSNEVGACLLECLSRIYNSALGYALFKNLFIFHEIPQDASAFSVAVPISSSVMDLMDDGDEDAPKGFTLRIVVIRRIFPGHRKANIGLIAYEVAQALSSDAKGASQILKVLSESEAAKFRRMDPRLRAGWLIQHWGLQEELGAFQREIQQKAGMD